MLCYVIFYKFSVIFKVNYKKSLKEMCFSSVFLIIYCYFMGKSFNERFEFIYFLNDCYSCICSKQAQVLKYDAPHSYSRSCTITHRASKEQCSLLILATPASILFFPFPRINSCFLEVFTRFPITMNPRCFSVLMNLF